MSRPWPPPPDMESLKELFANADVEGLIADDCPIDEYDPEAKHFFEITSGWKSEQFTAARTLPVLTQIFEEQFQNSKATRPAIERLSAEIERFFGPEAKPQVRNA